MTVDAENSVVPMNDLSRGIARDRAALDDAAASVITSGYVIRGPHHSRFQSELADYLGVTHAIGVASGTDALEIALRAVMPEGRSTVLAAANAGGYTSVAAHRAGYAVRYADVDPATLCVDLDAVQAALTEDVGVVVVTHLYGLLTDIAALVDYCHAHGVKVVEDCAQAIGARLNGRAAGSFGDVAAISFYPTKNLGALGDGGAIVTGDGEIAERVGTLSQYGWATKYHIETPGGTNSRLDEIQAAFLSARLPMLDALNERRRQIIERYRAAAAGGPVAVLPASGPHHVGHLAVALTTDRAAVRAALAAHGVQTDVHFPVPDHAQPGLPSHGELLPVTEKVADQVFSLPCFPELTDDEVQQVCEAISELC